MQIGILSGIRILDLSIHRAGQMAARILAEAGADVVKVEPPGGDVARSEPGFIVSNRSKRSLILDLDTAAGRADLTRLLSGAMCSSTTWDPLRPAFVDWTMQRCKPMRSSSFAALRRSPSAIRVRTRGTARR